MVTGIPAAVAISAATTFDRMPPEPSGEVDSPMSYCSSWATSVTSVTGSAELSWRGSAV